MTHKIKVTIEIDGESWSMRGEVDDNLVKEAEIDIIQEFTTLLAETILYYGYTKK